MIRSLYKIGLDSYLSRIGIIIRCRKLGIPVVKKGRGNGVDEKYLNILNYKMRAMDMYWIIDDWIMKFPDEGMREYLYAEMFDLDYTELSRFIIRKELI